MAHLSLSLLGTLQATLDGQPVTGFESNKARALLAYLAVEAQRPHPREVLAALFWPDWPQRSALGNLRYALANVRKAIGDQQTQTPYLLVSTDTLQFNVASNYFLDVSAFSECIAAGDGAALQRAAALYRGSFLEGFALGDSAAFEEWLTRKREQFTRQLLAALRQLAENCEQAGDYSEAQRFAWKQLEIEPWLEEGHQQLMRSLALGGQRSAALAQYETCRRLLADELGVEPSAETNALYESIRAGTLKRALPAADEAMPAPGEPPFKGLQYFDESDAALFFGREELTARLVTRLTPPPDVAGVGFLAIIGASGSGKSSLLRAGLVPVFRQMGLPSAGSACWLVHVLTPTAHPLDALAANLTPEAESLTITAALSDDFARDRRCLRLYAGKLLGRAIPSMAAPPAQPGRLLIVVDQFEELFTLCRDENERQSFIENLLDASDAGAAAVVIALRADFYAHCAQFSRLRQLLCERQEYIGPMNAAELRRAIEEPAQLGKWELEAGLVDLILRDAGGEPGSLPLVSHALLETWQRRRGRRLTLAGYAETGGVRGAIAKTAETVFSRLLPAEQTLARRIFLRLTEPGESAQDTRRRATLDELISQPEERAAVEALLGTLADARLITLGNGVVEFAHEALIYEWPALREWLNQDRDNLRLQRHLTQSAQAWEKMGRDVGELYRGARLAQAADWGADPARSAAMNALERAFLSASQEFAEREAREREAQRLREVETARKLAETEKARAEEQQRNNRRLRWRALWLTAALLVAAALAAAAFVFGQQAINRERIATARELAQAALNSLTIDPERSLLLGLESSVQWAAAGQPLPYDLQETLHQALLASRARLTWTSGGDDILFVGFDPQTDAPRVVTGDIAAAQVKIWDVAANQVLLTLPGRVDHFTDIAFSPDGKYMVVPGSDNVVRVWEVNTGQVWRSLAGHTGELQGAVFSPDGKLLATYGLNEQIVWDVETGERLLETPAPVTENDVVAFSPDGKSFATVSGSQVVLVLEIASGREVLARQHDFDVVSFAFSPDGSRVAVGGRNSAVSVWSAATGEEVFNLPVLSAGQVEAVAFSPDGTRLVAGPKMWDAATGNELFQLLGHTKGISRLAFNASGTLLITSSYDGTARVWDLTPSHEVFNLNHPMMVFGIAFSPDGKLIATASGDRTTVLWDAATGQALRRLAGQSDFVNAVAFSPDGKLLATGGADRTVIIWDVASGESLRILAGHAEDKPGTLPILRGVMAAAFSPECAQTSGAAAQRCPLASVGMDGQLIVWDALNGEKLLSYQDEIGGLKSVAYSPDGKLLAVGNTGDFNNPVGAATLLDADTGEIARIFPAYPGWVWGLAFSPDGERLAAVFFWGVGKVWDVQNGAEWVSLEGLNSGFSLAYSPDGKRIATGGGEGSVHLWDAQTGVPLFALTGPTDPVAGLAFSPDGKVLALASFDGAARVYAATPENLLAVAKARVTRTLTIEECQKYLHLPVCP